MVDEASSLSARAAAPEASASSRDFLPPLFAFVALAAVLVLLDRHEYPELHTTLDTGMFLMSVVLSSLLWEIGRRLDRGFPIWLAASFGLTAALECLHVAATIDWWGDLLPLLALPTWLRPTTWSPSAYLLPIGLAVAIWRLNRGERPMPFFLPALALIGAALFAVFQYIPANGPPGILGITRPALIGVPLLWAVVGWSAWQVRSAERKLIPITVMAVIMVCGNTAILYSQAPHDDLSMVAHLSRVMGYLALVLSVMRMASGDMRHRIQAERALARLNAELESRVAERTLALETANQLLEGEVAERTRTEQSLRESELRLRTLAESLPQLVWTCNPDGWCDYLSPQWLEYTGRPESEQIGFGWAEQLHPDDRERAQAAWTAATERGDYFDVEFRIRRFDGVYRWFKTRALPLRDSTGRIVKWFGSNTDIQEMKFAEERLQTHLGRLNLLHQITRAIGERQDLASIFQVVVRSVEDQLPADFCALCLYDPADHVLTVSGVGTKSLDTAMALAMPERARIEIDANGLSRCLLGHLVYEPDLATLPFPFPNRLLQGGLRSMVLAPLQVESAVFGVLVTARRTANSFSSPECEFLRQLSEHVALAAHQAQLYGALQQAYDDLRQSQQSVMQQERLRVLGQMASGIAHDINNALTPASLYTETLLEDDQTLSTNSRELLSVVHRAINDVTQTVARMREFYRPQDAQISMAPIALNDLVRQVLELTRARWHDMPMQRGVVVGIQLDLAGDLPPTQGVESEIREALINLLLNAVDAMPNGGTIRFATTAEPAGEGRGPRIRCEITDTGTGMDEETRRRCLEPFFTTKGERGTGLGLAMVYGVLQRHSADLEIESAPGRGTTMRLIFPAADPARVQAPDDGAEPVRPPRLPLLVIDDDPILLQTLRNILEADGHSVMVANGGEDGIVAFRDALRTGRPIAAVITDLGMPNIDGRKVAAAIKAESPETPIILLTGWGQRLIDDDDAPAHVDRVLSKPPKLRDLRQALAEVCTS
jgi:PAS domain S-box-containing protein